MNNRPKPRVVAVRVLNDHAKACECFTCRKAGDQKAADRVMINRYLRGLTK